MHLTGDETRCVFDRSRLILAFVALVTFILCFTPTPIQPMELIGR